MFFSSRSHCQQTPGVPTQTATQVRAAVFGVTLRELPKGFFVDAAEGLCLEGYCLCCCHWNLLSSIPVLGAEAILTPLGALANWGWAGEQSAASITYSFTANSWLLNSISTSFLHFVYLLLEGDLHMLTPFNDDARKSCRPS
jgi:hypothetical protein